MDALDAYSLLLCLVAGSVSVLLALRARFILGDYSAGEPGNPALPKAQRLARVASALVGLGAVSGCVSFIVHALWAHGPNSRSPMSTAELVLDHPSFLVMILAVAGGFVSLLAARARIATHIRGAGPNQD